MKKLFKSVSKRLSKIFPAFRHVHYGSTDNLTLLDDLRLFVPNSSGFNSRPELTLSGAKNTIPLLSKLAQDLADNIPVTPIEEFDRVVPHDQHQAELIELLNRYGSDKASTHNYHIVYNEILSKFKQDGQKVNLLEIGLGTNNTDVVSNMGRHGKPGASLRAFRDFLPSSSVFGADVDKRVLFEESRIKTYFVDQTAPETFDAMIENMGVDQLDVIIDDGLHSPEANLNTLRFGLKHLKESGWLVIEDIPKVSLPVWYLSYQLLKQKYTCWIVSSKSAYLFVLKK